MNENVTVKEICEALSVTPSSTAGDDLKAYSDVLSSWHKERGSAETTYLSELIRPLSHLNIKSLDANTLSEKTDGKCSSCY